MITASPICERKPAVKKWTSYLLFFALWVSYSYVHQDLQGGNHTSRIDLLSALVMEGRLEIDSFHRNTDGKALVGEHYYSDKAPGTACAALPAFFISNIIDGNKASKSAIKVSLFKSWFTTAGSVGLLTAIGGVFAFRWLNTWVRPVYAILATLFIFLGSLPFPYATSLHSHGLVISLIFASLYFLNIGPNAGEDVVSAKCLFLGGFCAGGALASEYSAGLVVIAIALLAILKCRRILPFLFGSMIPVSLVLLYNWRCFGDPLSFGYSHNESFPEMQSGFFGIHSLASLPSAFDLLLGQRAGLFIWSPFLAMAIIGLIILNKKRPDFSYIFYLCILLHVLTISAYWLPSGGSGLGPRLLSPLIPFIAVASTIAFEKSPVLGCFLGFISILLTGGSTLISAYVPPEVVSPITEFLLPKIYNGDIAQNLGRLAGLPEGYSSLLITTWIIAATAFLVWGVQTPHQAPTSPA
jgi:hypothetical protein